MSPRYLLVVADEGADTAEFLHRLARHGGRGWKRRSQAAALLR